MANASRMPPALELFTVSNSGTKEDLCVPEELSNRIRLLKRAFAHMNASTKEETTSAFLEVMDAKKVTLVDAGYDDDELIPGFDSPFPRALKDWREIFILAYEVLDGNHFKSVVSLHKRITEAEILERKVRFKRGVCKLEPVPVVNIHSVSVPLPSGEQNNDFLRNPHEQSVQQNIEDLPPVPHLQASVEPHTCDDQNIEPNQSMKMVFSQQPNSQGDDMPVVDKEPSNTQAEDLSSEPLTQQESGGNTAVTQPTPPAQPQLQWQQQSHQVLTREYWLERSGLNANKFGRSGTNDQPHNPIDNHKEIRKALESNSFKSNQSITAKAPKRPRTENQQQDEQDKENVPESLSDRIEDNEHFDQDETAASDDVVPAVKTETPDEEADMERNDSAAVRSTVDAKVEEVQSQEEPMEEKSISGPFNRTESAVGNGGSLNENTSPAITILKAKRPRLSSPNKTSLPIDFSMPAEDPEWSDIRVNPGAQRRSRGVRVIQPENSSCTMSIRILRTIKDADIFALLCRLFNIPASRDYLLNVPDHLDSRTLKESVFLKCTWSKFNHLLVNGLDGYELKKNTTETKIAVAHKQFTDSLLHKDQCETPVFPATWPITRDLQDEVQNLLEWLAKVLGRASCEKCGRGFINDNDKIFTIRLLCTINGISN